MKRVTIYDVAKEAKVSLATVSRVINGLEIVREDTRLRVNEAIEKLGYKPNAIAQGLALQKTTTIALVVPEASFSYTGQIINGLLDVAKIYKYNIMLHTVSEGIVEIGEIIVCPDCGVDLEIVSLDPAEIQPAPMEQEDWGE